MSAKDELKKKLNPKLMEKDLKKLKIIKALNEAFATDSGIQALKHLRNMCGFSSSSVVANPQTGEINFNSTIYNEARRNIYLELRQFIKPNILKKVEF